AILSTASRHRRRSPSTSIPSDRTSAKTVFDFSIIPRSLLRLRSQRRFISGRCDWLVLLLLLSLVSDLQFLDGLAFLFISQLNLSGEHDAHRTGRILQEVFERAPETALHVCDGV